MPRIDFSVGADLRTFAITGTATLDGDTYHPINTISSSNVAHLYLHLIGTTVLPPVNGSSLVIHAPFIVAPDSSFTYDVTPGSNTEAPERATVALRGRGTATVSFLANPSVPVWEFNQMRYEFVPTPEPTTLVLVGGGLAATLLRARTLRRNSPTSTASKRE